MRLLWCQDIFPTSQYISSDLRRAPAQVSLTLPSFKCLQAQLGACRDFQQSQAKAQQALYKPQPDAFFRLHPREASFPQNKSCPSELQDTAGSPAPPCAVISLGATTPESGKNSLLLSEADQKQKIILYLKPMI